VTDSHEDKLEEHAVAAAPGFARLTGQSALFALGSIIGKVIGLAMLPVLTRLLTPTEFGSMDVLMSLGSALTAPLLLGLDVATLRLYFDQPDEKARRRLVGTSYAIVLGVTLLAGAVIAVGSGAISAALFAGSELQLAVIAVAVSVVGGAVQAIALTVLRAEGRAGMYAAYLAASSLLYALLAVALLKLWRADANAMLVAYATSVIVSSLTATVLVRRDVLGRPASSSCWALLRLGLPLVPAAAAVYLADFLNRTVLLGAAGAAGVAYFTVAARFGSVAGLVVVGFRLAWQPRAYALGTSAPARIRLATDARWIVATVCAAVTVIAVASPEVVELAAGRQYASALPPLAFSLVTVLLGSLDLVASLPSAMARAMQDLAMASVANAAVALACNLLLAANLHGTGTAIAVAAGELVEVVILVRLGKRRLPLPVDWVRLGGLVAVVSLSVVVLLAISAPLPARLAVGGLTLSIVAWSVPLRQALRQLTARLSQ
jgi:O-antigen/teichoic acid export membrane protein